MMMMMMMMMMMRGRRQKGRIKIMKMEDNKKINLILLYAISILLSLRKLSHPKYPDHFGLKRLQKIN
jgi:hypothetical protein